MTYKGVSNHPNFKNNLLELRKNNKLRQADLGTAIGVTPQTISAWEKGKADPNKSKLFALADFFDVDPAALQDGYFVEQPILRESGQYDEAGDPILEQVGTERNLFYYPDGIDDIDIDYFLFNVWNPLNPSQEELVARIAENCRFLDDFTLRILFNLTAKLRSLLGEKYDLSRADDINYISEVTQKIQNHRDPSQTPVEFDFFAYSNLINTTKVDP